ncbi:MAG: hypothetical protein DI635_07445 [Pseudoxanthomonas suwonensis]|nr:MAG: hypothetical protein DI635_07445 [Pseudoxanthomonas suwonensis]
MQTSQWFDDYADQEDTIQVDEYDIIAAPNDFNVLTINSFIESGAVRIPGFQRNYVWDLGRASKLIESLILGLPVPQVFLYEIERNSFLVIDGQQRLMSIYYFIKQRFPRADRRSDIRTIFDENGRVPDEIIHNDNYFENFRLKLSKPGQIDSNKFSGLSYLTLGSYKPQFELRTIRNVIIKQSSPQGDDSSMYEVFNRLNTGGVNLKPQEIRTSMYHSAFYEILYRINAEPTLRKLFGNTQPDIHMKDIEILLRAFAFLLDGKNYSPSMIRFLNEFSRKARAHTAQQNDFLKELFQSFLVSAEGLPDNVFLNRRSGRLNVALFESVFYAASRNAFSERRPLSGSLTVLEIEALEQDSKFNLATQEGTTQTRNVRTRLDRAESLISAL